MFIAMFQSGIETNSRQRLSKIQSTQNGTRCSSRLSETSNTETSRLMFMTMMELLARRISSAGIYDRCAYRALTDFPEMVAMPAGV